MLSGNGGFISNHPHNPPASGGKCFLHLQMIYPVYTLAKGKSILPPRSRGGLGWGELGCDTFPDSLLNPLLLLIQYIQTSYPNHVTINRANRH
jgi:hypothetical protein